MVTKQPLMRDTGGAAATEFALVLPLLLILMFGIIDAGRFLWTVNMAEKATQAGARYAVATSPVASGIATTSFVGVDGLTQGDRIPASVMSTVTCTAGGCGNCASCPAGIPGAFDGTAFANVVARMHYYYPAVGAANVTVEYRGSGIGFAGDPNGAQIAPLVTVKLRALEFRPITALLFATIPLPSFSTTLTAEDLSGTLSN